MPETTEKKKYKGSFPPCGVDCNKCEKFHREKNPCPGADIHCEIRQCASFYKCCREKKGLQYCHECKKYPCSRFKQFAKLYIDKYDQDLFKNQKKINKKLKKKKG